MIDEVAALMLVWLAGGAVHTEPTRSDLCRNAQELFASNPRLTVSIDGRLERVRRIECRRMSPPASAGTSNAEG